MHREKKIQYCDHVEIEISCDLKALLLECNKNSNSALINKDQNIFFKL